MGKYFPSALYVPWNVLKLSEVLIVNPRVKEPQNTLHRSLHSETRKRLACCAVTCLIFVEAESGSNEQDN